MTVYNIKKENLKNLEKFFINNNKTFIWSCLQGYMGEAYGDDAINPESVQIITADFCIFAGIANIDLVNNKPAYSYADYIIMIPENKDWGELIEKAFKDRAKKIISGASSYTVYQDGIEIEVDTHKDFRRQGFAYLCCAKLILECVERNIYPSWDAHNKASLELSKKLGYHPDKKYDAYEIHNW